MKKLISLFFALLSFPVFSSENEILSEHASNVQVACASLMRDVEIQYGRSYFCKTDNEIAETMNASFLVESLHPGAEGILIRFDNIFYIHPENKSGALNYSYNVIDFNAVISLINSGHGLTAKQKDHLACRASIDRFEKIVKQTNSDFKNSKITADEYEELRKIQLATISKLEKQCPNGIVLS